MTTIELSLFHPVTQSMLEASFNDRTDDPIRRWLAENAVGRWRVVGSTVMFEDTTDAAMFIIRFNDAIER